MSTIPGTPDFRRHAPADRLPTLIRTRTGYRVFDPALTAGTHYLVDDSGTLVWTRLPAGSTALAVLVAGVAAAGALGTDWLSCLLWGVAGLVVGAGLAVLALSLVHAVSNPERSYRQRTAGGAYAIDATDPDSREFALCAAAERVAATQSWVTGRVDRERRLPDLLWAGVLGSDWAADEIARLANPATGPSLRAPA